MDQQNNTTVSGEEARPVEMSYKFQRLREKLRQAVASGELSGKLPGERELARRFSVNAKTLGKALTDLAGEGLLVRSIGRGTFVKGTLQTIEPANIKPWLILCNPGESQSALVAAIRAIEPQAQAIEAGGELRPSFLNQFSAVVDLASNTPDALLRDLMVRGLPLVVVGREPRHFSTHCVLIDLPYQVGCLARDLMMLGHRRIVAAEEHGHTAVSDALRLAATRYAPDAWIESCRAQDIDCAADFGATAVLCESTAIAVQVQEKLCDRTTASSQPIAIAAVGAADGVAPCTGYFVSSMQISQAIAQLLRTQHPTRPTPIWLVGEKQDRGTLDPAGTPSESQLIPSVANVMTLSA